MRSPTASCSCPHPPLRAACSGLLARLPEAALGNLLTLLTPEEQEAGLRPTSVAMNAAVVAATTDPLLQELHAAQGAFRTGWQAAHGPGALARGDARIQAAMDNVREAINARQDHEACCQLWASELQELAARVQQALNAGRPNSSRLGDAFTVLAYLGRNEMAAQVLRRCVRMRGRVETSDLIELSRLAFRARDPEQAIGKARMAIELAESSTEEDAAIATIPLARGLLLALRVQPDTQLAQDARRELLAMLASRSLRLDATRALVELAVGDPLRCRADLAALKRRNEDDGSDMLDILEIELALGDRKQALAAMEQVFRAPESFVWQQLQDRFLDTLEHDADFLPWLRLMHRDRESLDAIPFVVPADGNAAAAPRHAGARH